MSAHRLARLFVHPLKSAGGLEVARWPLDALGLRHDRALMLVEPDGTFVTLRGTPRTVTIRPRQLGPDETRVVLEAEGRTPLEVSLDGQGSAVPVQIWGEWVDAISLGSEAAAWCSAHLGRRVELVRFDRAVHRQVDLGYARPGDAVGFADGFPLLVVGSASLEDLGTRLGQPVEVERFRPNLVIETNKPYEEDGWRRIRVGTIELELVKPCARCVGITVHPSTAQTSREPLRTLSTHRKREGQVYFGHNVLHRGVGWLSVGDPVEIVERVAPPGAPL